MVFLDEYTILNLTTIIKGLESLESFNYVWGHASSIVVVVIIMDKYKKNSY